MNEMTRAKYRNNKHKNKSLKIFFYIIGIIFLIVISFFVITHFEKNYQQKQAIIRNYPVRGIYVNQNDDYADFSQLEQRGIKYVYIRASQGASYTDDDFSDNYSRSIGSGLKIGIYHQYGFGSSVKNQEKNIVNSLDNNIGDLPISINVDYYGDYNSDNINRQKTKQNIEKMANYLGHKYHRAIIIKTNQDLYHSLKNIKNVQFVTTDESTNKNNVKFINLSKKNSVYNNGKNSDYPMTAFLGNKKKWSSYLKILRNGDTLNNKE